MERALLFLTTLLLVSSAWAGGEAVSFPGPSITLQGRLYRPAGDGPFPAFVLLHGCNGLWQREGQPYRSYEAWARHWQEHGYLALLVDSFGPRGEKEICTQRNRRISPERDRPRDAYAALRWLAARADVDAARIHLQGWSNGAMAVLSAIAEDAPGRTGDGPQFRSAVAFYPGCGLAMRRLEYRTHIPLLIEAGAADDWTPAVHCEALVQKFRGPSTPMDIDVYPGAHHAFDGFGAVRERPEVRNASSPTGWGATVGANPEARAKALQRTTEWVAEHDR